MSPQHNLSRKNSDSRNQDERVEALSEEQRRTVPEQLASLEEKNTALQQEITDLKQCVRECRRVVGELRESEVLFRTLFDSMSEGYTLSDLIYDESGFPIDYRALEVNPAIEKLLGLPRSMIVGRRISDVFPRMNPPLARFDEMIRTGSRHILRITVRRFGNGLMCMHFLYHRETGSHKFFWIFQIASAPSWN